MKYKLVYLEWSDATSNSAWHSEEELAQWGKNSGWIVKQVGWLFEENDKYIVIFSSMADGGKNEGEENHYGNLQKIPKTWIRKRKVLKI